MAAQMTPLLEDLTSLMGEAYEQGRAVQRGDRPAAAKHSMEALILLDRILRHVNADAYARARARGVAGVR